MPGDPEEGELMRRKGPRDGAGGIHLNTDYQSSADHLFLPPKPSPEYVEPLDMCLSDDAEVLYGPRKPGSSNASLSDTGHGIGLCSREGILSGDKDSVAQPCYKLK